MIGLGASYTNFNRKSRDPDNQEVLSAPFYLKLLSGDSPLEQEFLAKWCNPKGRFLIDLERSMPTLGLLVKISAPSYLVP